jgi:DUF438 domain-containing protein
MVLEFELVFFFSMGYVSKVSEVFNDFFINVAKNIGNTNVIVNKEHPSVCMIKENKLITDDLNFKPVSSDFVSRFLFNFI